MVCLEINLLVNIQACKTVLIFYKGVLCIHTRIIIILISKPSCNSVYVLDSVKSNVRRRLAKNSKIILPGHFLMYRAGYCVHTVHSEPIVYSLTKTRENKVMRPSFTLYCCSSVVKLTECKSSAEYCTLAPSERTTRTFKMLNCGKTCKLHMMHYSISNCVQTYRSCNHTQL